MNDVELKVLRFFEVMRKNVLDLHELFEAGGNDPDARREVFYAVESLVADGFLEERGGDFYSLSGEARRLLSDFDKGGQ